MQRLVGPTSYAIDDSSVVSAIPLHPEMEKDKKHPPPPERQKNPPPGLVGGAARAP